VLELWSLCRAHRGVKQCSDPSLRLCVCPMLPAQKRCISIEHYCSTILLLYTTIEPHAKSRAHWSVWPPEVTDTGGAYRFVAIWPYLVRARRRLWFRVKLELTLGPRHMLGGGKCPVFGWCRRLYRGRAVDGAEPCNSLM